MTVRFVNETVPPPKSKYFIALDGESINGSYVLLGTSHPSYCLENKQGITTIEALEFLWRLGSNRHLRKRNTTFVGYFFSYDVEMICKDLPNKIKQRLFNPRLILDKKTGGFKKDRIYYKEYELTYIKRKYFSVRRKGMTQNGITIYDASGFFTGFPDRSFVGVLQQMQIEVPMEISHGKEARSNFSWQDYPDIKKYCLLECSKLVELMEKIYTMCEVVGLVPKRWYGSSALANYALSKWKIRDFMRRTVQENMSGHFWDAITRAYFGGRIEAFKLGTFENIFAYDINSAYPAAIALLPATRENHFIYTTKFRPGFAIWHVRFRFPKSLHIGVFPFRLSDGSIKFPLRGEGYYWNPEVELAIKKWPQYVDVIEGYYLQDNKKETPFKKLFPQLYKERAKYKARGDLTHFVIKIVLNACYGKFAQKVGRADYKNFTWAGWITSYTRARLREAIIGKENSVIAFSTDGIYTLKKLKLKESPALGDWDFSQFHRGTVLMSGLYLLEGEKNKRGTRGYPKISDWENILDQLNSKEKKASIQVNMFIGFNMAHNFPEVYGPHYLKFIQEEKILNPHNLSKRKYASKKIKDWKKDSCESEPIMKLSGISNAIKTVPDFVNDDDIIFSESVDEVIWYYPTT